MKFSHPALKHPNVEHAARMSMTERFCKRVAEGTGAPMTLVAVILFQLVWIIIGQLSHRDPFPFIFMLTVSNVVQLILIVVLAVGGKQQAAHSEIRAEHDHDALSRLLFLQGAHSRALLAIAEKQGIDPDDPALSGLAYTTDTLTTS